MTVRSTKKTVRIDQSFRLRGCAQTLEPGIYLIETDERLLEGHSFNTYERLKTFIHLHSTSGCPGIDRVLSISGDDLDNAIRSGRAEYELETRDRSAGDADAVADLNALDRAEDEGMIRASKTD